MRRLKLLVFFLCRLAGLFRLAGWLTRDRLKILCYHGFALDDEAAFRPKLFIRPETFADRLETLHRYGMQVLPLDEAVERLYAGTLPPRALALTVDDGFHSVHRLAAPALRRHALPATVYVTTYYVEHPHPIFRLVIQYMFWKTRRTELEWKDVPWAADGVIDLRDAASREAAAWACIRHGETRCTEAERHDISRRVGGLLAVSYEDIEAARILHLMTPEELREVAASGLDIQLHTHRHVFPEDNAARAHREIADNRAALCRLLGEEREFRHFCYPSGLWDECQWAWLDDMGVKSSTTCLAGLNTQASNRHALRRFLDGENIHPLEFEAALCGFAELLRLRPKARWRN